MVVRICSKGNTADNHIQMSAVQQEAHGPHRSPEKTVQIINKYDYNITLFQRIKKKLYENLLVLHLNKLESPSPKDALCQDWLKYVVY